MKIIIKKIFYSTLCLLILFASIALLSYKKLPARDKTALQDNPIPQQVSTLSNLIKQQADLHPNLSGIEVLEKGEDAFAMRAILAAHADQTIDAQYYIWHNDITGRLLLLNLYQAAERGVRVRLLLDDNNTNGMDELLYTLNQHPNISIRLFNPFLQRKIRPLSYLSDFSRLNRRMHNKSFTVDNTASIIGGRNIGNEYFNAGDGVMFADLDVLSVGKVLDEVTNDFTRYWQSASTYPLELIINKDNLTLSKNAQQQIINELIATKHSQEAKTYLQAVAKTPLLDKLRNQSIPQIWAKTRLLSDNPSKGLSAIKAKETVLGKIQMELGDINNRLTLISPYFVPTKSGTEALINLRQQGVVVKVLTNSLEANDVAAVHAGYAKYRPQLLTNNISLYELKPEAAITKTGYDHGMAGSSGSSLHAKTFIIDGERVFVGSFNMDPRSTNLNTEMGLIIESPELATTMEKSIDESLDKVAYKVELTDGKMVWKDNTISIYHDPQSSLAKRIAVKVIGWLPIEFLL